MITSEEKIQRNRDNIEAIYQEIHAFQSKQLTALTFFEELCKKKQPETRTSIAKSLRFNGQEMMEHGFYVHYHNYLTRELEKSGVPKKHIESMIVAYYFSGESEKKEFTRNIAAGVVKKREPTISEEANKTYKEMSLADIGKNILRETAFALHSKKSVFNFKAQFKNKSDAEKAEIVRCFRIAQSATRNEGIKIGVKKLTDGLLPHFFKESQPYKNQSMALYAAFLSRPEKFHRMRILIETFSWIFLTHDDLFTPENYIRQITSTPKKKTVKAIMKQTENQR